MANFEPSFEKLMHDEGGFKLVTVEGDRGGMTYAGIARNMNPDWPGWSAIDRKEIPPTQMVRDFYHQGYWEPIRGDELPQTIADTIFNFAVNTSAPKRPVLAIKLAQLVVKATPDGVLGEKTLAALKAFDESKFVMAYALAKIARYRDICMKDRSQVKFLLGWINRVLGGL
ncbi:Peptidoglycan binding domain containing protein [uncultured Caudovirales phage]|uniref:Peptidoglycan binding domain containing protein n=1 Tax=uncultured Caudovirales phage TaxID=2100421 RepID=A0A6J7WQX4_9CAUD|nr:Peptidoglycan binding domain containing protein [uncultured Caudovirales phage]